MNLIEALKTGLPLRRPVYKSAVSDRNGFFSNEFLKDKLLGNDMSRSTYLSVEDIFADDWEVKERTYEFTKPQILLAVAETLKKSYSNSSIGCALFSTTIFLKELGIETNE